MKQKSYLALALTAFLAMPAMAQDRNNEDEVAKVNASFASYNYREGELIVKFKDQSMAQVKATRGKKLKSSGVSSVDAALQELGVTEVEALMPLTGSQKATRLTRAFNGQVVTAPSMSRLYLMHYDKTKAINAKAAAEKLSALSDVEYAEPNMIVYALGTAAPQASMSRALEEVQDSTAGQHVFS